MEELTKTQLILLALLVSFVTSIATGIVTVTLLDQAPPGVTQTINRVVERTVEKVVPGQAASVITKETTVIIKEENLIIDAVDKNSRSVVRIALLDEKGGFGTTLGIGVIVSTDGKIVTDVLNLTDSDKYLIKLANGNVYLATLSVRKLTDNLSLLKIEQNVKDGETALKLTKPSFADNTNLRLGQTIIAIGGLGENAILTGVISKLNKETLVVDSGTSTSTTEAKKTEVLKSIVTNVNLSADYSGGPLLDVDGFLLAININRKDGNFSVPIGPILDIISKKLENTQTVGTNTETI